ncbi:hypothetical protein fHeYen902_328c [Yersinia phage fHe-Yen9-02]|nr:hypothetical protein fHeYen902_328c [Yersinia phage fHe-Yen9-02]
MPAFGRLAIKDPSTGKWISNLAVGGTKVRAKSSTGGLIWVRMTINNTKVKNPDAGKEGQPEWITITG